MMTHLATLCVLLLLAAGLGLHPTCLAQVEGDLTAPATDDEMARLIRDLGDSSYQTRTQAMRRLSATGPAAAAALEVAAKGEDFETALRAKKLLTALDRLLFAGLDVSLAFSAPAVAWDESIDLEVTLTNRSKYAARVPFESQPGSDAGGDARQVAAMLDIADWIHVRGADDREIELRVDDIAADPEVVAAVQTRLNGGPSSMVEPGGRVSLTVRAFNRGYARYPLLDEGNYVVAFEYVPAWEDEVLRARRIGRVAGNPASIHIRSGAPRTVSRTGVEAVLTVGRTDGWLAAKLTNSTDQSLFINRNFGNGAPFADGRWMYQLDESIHAIPVMGKTGASWHDFDPTLMSEVKPGQSVELTRIELGELRRALVAAGADLSGDRWTLYFSYMNSCDRSWQTRQGAALLDNAGAPKIFQIPLPRRTLSTRHASEALTAPLGD